MRIATWNINSIAVRASRVRDWLIAAQPDVLCLQELKVAASEFPLSALNTGRPDGELPIDGPTVEELGYEVAAHGDGRWNGVAVLSRIGIADVVRDLPGQPPFADVVEPRAIGVTCGPVRVWSLYTPNGRTPQDPHYGYKLEWLDGLGALAAAEPHPITAYLGDFNIAPTDSDVWDISAFVGSTHVTPAERARLTALEGAGLVEVVPRALKYDTNYTYWDYRQLAFPKNNGMRIDLVYGTTGLAEAVTDAYVDRDARKPGKNAPDGTKPIPPSDHAPVVVDLDIAVS